MSIRSPSPERIERYRRGRLSEWVAAAALIAKGYLILGRRVRTPFGEVDLIAVRGKRLAFVEVKRRATRAEGEAAVARELTKLHEEVRRGTPAELAQWATEAPPRGEMVILVGPPAAETVTDEAILTRLEPLLARMSLSDAARKVAEEFGVPKSRPYALGLALKGTGT